MMTGQAQSDEIVGRLFEQAVNQGRLEVIHELYAPQFVDHAPGPGQAPGPSGIVEAVERYRAAIPDLHVTVEDILVCGDRLVTLETWRGTHRHALAGLPATNKSFEMTRMHIFRLADGMIVEEWTAGSVLNVLRAAGQEDGSER
jgi:predicted ester cyclase